MCLLYVIVNKEAIMFEKPLANQKTLANPRPRIRPVIAAGSVDVVNKRGAAVSRIRKSGFKKSDVWRAISAAQKGGVTVSEMEIAQDGAIRLKFATDHLESNGLVGNDEFDQWVDRL